MRQSTLGKTTCLEGDLSRDIDVKEVDFAVNGHQVAYDAMRILVPGAHHHGAHRPAGEYTVDVL